MNTNTEELVLLAQVSREGQAEEFRFLDPTDKQRARVRFLKQGGQVEFELSTSDGNIQATGSISPEKWTLLEQINTLEYLVLVPLNNSAPQRRVIIDWSLVRETI